MAALGQNGVIPVVPPAVLEQQLQQAAADKAAARQPAPQDVQGLAGYIRTQFEIFRNHRNTQAGWSERLLRGLRAFNGQYDAGKLQEIRRFGGSEIYARMIAQKCRAASSLLRDVYLGADRTWGFKPPADPDIPPDVEQKIDQLMAMEMQMLLQAGQQPSPSATQERRRQLLESASQAAKKRALGQAKTSEDKVEEILREGGWYRALAEFLVDLPIFVFACIKGPVVKVVPTVTWPPNGGMPKIEQKPRLTWNRVSPFDIWFTPGVAAIENAAVIEKQRITRAELNDLLDLPGYDHDAIRRVLDEYGRGGLYDNWDTTDAERSVLENRENPAWNRSGLITMMEFHGNVQGRILQDYGLAVPDELRDYSVQCWVVGQYVIKCHLNPSPRQRHPYFITSYEKVPGTPVGNGLTDLLEDVQEAGNATLRALINNLSIASGPQVVIDDSRLSPEENGEDLYPWKRWHTRNDPLSAGKGQAIEFFQPNSYAEQLIKCYKEFLEIADDVSAIPKYVGGSASGGAGRTASGLAMLMGNASKILQTVAANIDRDVVEQGLQNLVDLVLLTDTTGILTGEEKLSVQGVTVAIQRETLRQRQLEFLQATANPLDSKLMGLKGRGTVLRSVSDTLGMSGEKIVPSDDELDRMEQAQRQQSAEGPIGQMVAEGVHKGIQAGVQQISKELTAGGLAAQAHMPDGSPAAGPPGVMPQGGDGSTEDAAAQAQGSQKGPLSTGHMGPHTRLVSPTPKGQQPIAGGVG